MVQVITATSFHFCIAVQCRQQVAHGILSKLMSLLVSFMHAIAYVTNYDDDGDLLILIFGDIMTGRSCKK